MPVNTGNAAFVGGGINLGVIGLAGTLFGMPLDALALGAFAGLAVNANNPASSWWRVLVLVAVSTLWAGAFSPVLVLALLHLLPFGAAAEQPLNIAVPVLIGGCWSWVAPLLRDAAKQLLTVWLHKLGGGK